MDDQNILDAPETEKTKLKFTFRLVLFSIIGFTIFYSLFIKVSSFKELDIYQYQLSVFNFDLNSLIFLAGTSIGLYLFLSFTSFTLAHWFRIMTVSISIVFISIMFSGVLIVNFAQESAQITFKSIVFAALIGGGGCSIAVQFLKKKYYMIFAATMICTIAAFSLIDN